MNPSYIIYIGLSVSLVILTVAIYFMAKASRKRNKQKQTGTLNQKLTVEKLKSDIVLNSIEDGVIVANSQGVIRVFNPAAQRLTGWPANEALGLDHRSILKFVDSKGVPYTEKNNPLLLTFSQTKTIRDNAAVLVSRDNKHIAINISASPLLDDSRQAIGVACIFRDVSLERQDEQKRADFISTASHEMRTPVAAIEGYLALAMNEKVSKIDDVAKGYLTKAHASTQHLGELFQDLLASAKAEDGRLISHPAVVEIGKFIEQLTEELRFMAQKKGLGLELILGSPATAGGRPGYARVIQPLFYAKVDPNRMREVLTNLFDNAVKYTPSGKISIGITGDQNIIQISLKDTGSGISAEDIPHLFQKFYRVDNSTTRTIGGTGLGLFICRKIVELYNGHIWVESQPGQGSTFFINLPRLSSQQAESVQPNLITPTNPTAPINIQT